MVMFDVIEAIILRCLVKDQLRCKSVCKSWYSLISSPSFAKTHVNFICNKEEHSTRKIDMDTSSCYITEIAENGDLFCSTPQDWVPYSKYRMQGSCNGLVCIYALVIARICVTNPVTREFIDIQQPPKRTSKETQCLGFGYDSSSNDYKVVMAICQRGGNTALVRILSLKSNIWKDFGQVNYRFNDHKLAVPGILFNGALHWFWHKPNDRNTILLVSFDLAKEEFREIPQPNDPRYVWNLSHTLGIIQGRLCIFPAFEERFDPTCGIWVMKNYNSWELFPKGSEMKDHAIHYMLKDSDEYRITPPTTYFCDENVSLSRSKEHIPSPMFVPSLVSPYVSNNNCGPSHAENNKNARNVQENKEIKEVYSVEDKEHEKKIVISLVEEGGLR